MTKEERQMYLWAYIDGFMDGAVAEGTYSALQRECIELASASADKWDTSTNKSKDSTVADKAKWMALHSTLTRRHTQ